MFRNGFCGQKIFNLLWHTSRFSKFRCFTIINIKQLKFSFCLKNDILRQRDKLQKWSFLSKFEKWPFLSKIYFTDSLKFKIPLIGLPVRKLNHFRFYLMTGNHRKSSSRCAQTIFFVQMTYFLRKFLTGTDCIFRALEELKKISKKTILDLYRHYFMDYIMFGLNSSIIDLLLDDNNLRLPHADLFKRKNSYWANSANREKYQAIRYC